MPKLLTESQVEAYKRDGYVAPLRIMSPEQAEMVRAKLEAVEADSGGPLSGMLRFKPHLLFTFLDELVRNENVLDGVEDVLGANLMCWASSFFTKEANDPSYVSWHQDSTYWGLSQPDVATAWIALSPSTRENGCMRVIPGSHLMDQVPHVDTHAKGNLLSRGQEVTVEVNENDAVDIELQPGEMSLHHVRLIHGSDPNRSNIRRIGFAVRYIPPYVRQTNGPHDTAGLVRGEDPYRNFEHEPQPAADLDPAAVAWHAKSAEMHGQLLYQGTDRQPYT